MGHYTHAPRCRAHPTGGHGSSISRPAASQSAARRNPIAKGPGPARPDSGTGASAKKSLPCMCEPQRTRVSSRDSVSGEQKALQCHAMRVLVILLPHVDARQHVASVFRSSFGTNPSQHCDVSAVPHMILPFVESRRAKSHARLMR